jgi:two-component system, OmpR family, sensor histidine kinase KdpD
MPQTEGVRTGKLIVYLGAAPGVGKTFAMLDEAHRRVERGTDVVVGFVETHGRPRTLERLAGLEVLPRRTTTYRGVDLGELDVDAVLARGPAIVLVDELAHSNVPGSRHDKRADDVAEIRAAGIDVITTVNIQHLESLNDDVERITGIRQRETVPDEVVRTADQIQLVDMSPDALRRRLAHGNVYTADKIDASLTSYFRIGNLTALRELALLWLADRVDDALDDYRRLNHIEDPWPARERVVVAVTGGAESETLLRRGARIAQRESGSSLMAVHVITADGLTRGAPKDLARIQRLVADVGGSFHTTVGEDVARAVVDFARGVNASMIVVGVSRHGRLRNLLTGATGTAVAHQADPIDVHLVTHEEVGRASLATRGTTAVTRRRRLTGWGLGLVAPLLLTVLLGALEDHLGLTTDMLLFLALTVAVALIGGRLPALFTALSGFLLLNWFFTPPRGEFTIASPENAFALVIFMLVASGVASVVDQAARQTEEARRARAEAATLASLSRSVLSGADTADALVSRLRETFGLTAVELVVRVESGWAPLAHAGGPIAGSQGGGEATRVAIDEDRALVLHGHPLPAADRRVVEAFATQAGLVLEYRRLRERAAQAAELEGAEATRTSLLRAVSHDLRTPLATIRASVDGLLGGALPPADTQSLTETVEAATTTLELLIDNLLDLSRLQAGMVQPVTVPTTLEEVLPAALLGLAPGVVDLDLAEDLPLVDTDAGLLARVVGNIVGNAIEHSPGSVRMTASARPGHVDILVIDRGPGLGPEDKQRMFEPFQRLGDRAPGGLGLGLAVAMGLADALGAEISAEDTPGGGLTMLISVPRTRLSP